MPPIAEVLLPAALAFIMFSVGITLVPADFMRLVREPRAVTAGLIGQLLVLPLAAWLLAVAWRLPPEMAVGLMILGACPGGASSALITHLARGTAALSITLTAITSVAAVVTVPLVVNVALALFLGEDSAVEMSVAKLVRGVFLITTVPVALGMVLRLWRPRLADRLQAGIGRVATLLFVLIVVAFFIKERSTIVANLATVGPAAASLVVVVMAAGIGLALAFRLSRRDGIAIASECGLQNAALGIFISTAVLATPALAVPSVVYALLMNIGALAFVFVARRWVGPAAVEPARA